MKLISSGNKGKWNYFMFNKDINFFSLFSKFLLGCGIKNLNEYEEYLEELPEIDSFKNKIDHFENEKYDIDIIFTETRIIVTIRTDIKNRENLVKGIKNML